MTTTIQFQSMKLVAVAVLAAGVTALTQAATFTWTTPTERVNGEKLDRDEICCYELIGYNSLGVQLWTKILETPSQVRLTLPDSELLGLVKFEIAVIDTDGLYSEFVEIKPSLLGVPQDLRIQPPTGLKLGK